MSSSRPNTSTHHRSSLPTPTPRSSLPFPPSASTSASASASTSAHSPGSVHPYVVRASNYRNTIGLTPSFHDFTSLDEEANSKSAPAFNFSCDCSRCGTPLANLLFRNGDTTIAFLPSYLCLACAPDAAPEAWEDSKEETEITYLETFSAAVDRLQGLSIAPEDTRPPPRKDRPVPVGSRKRSASEELINCDVCMRVLGTGGLVASDPRRPVEFDIEVVCVVCADSDIWAVDQLPAQSLDKFIDLAREMSTLNFYATLATPEILESGAAIWRTFQEAKNAQLDLWSLVEPMLRQEDALDATMRRYLAVRWSAPTHRKTKAPDVAIDNRQEDSDEDIPSSLIRTGKNLGGFVLAEMLLTGCLQLVYTTPWSAGDNFDGATILMQRLLRRVKRDIASKNIERSRIGQAPYPQLQKAWLHTYFKKDSRLTSHLVNRRGFLRLSDYLTKYPETDESHFPPHQTAILPVDYLKGLHILVRNIDPDDSWNARQPPKPRRRKGDTQAQPRR
ncbi:hypothetical protein MNV49_001866 [Pseudohyphozyma bogoriensis]|nr:hypothetical protein MNV49_001866 [Pseudohyphozyma bogoriensis]